MRKREVGKAKVLFHPVGKQGGASPSLLPFGDKLLLSLRKRGIACAERGVHQPLACAGKGMPSSPPAEQSPLSLAFSEGGRGMRSSPPFIGVARSNPIPRSLPHLLRRKGRLLPLRKRGDGKEALLLLFKKRKGAAKWGTAKQFKKEAKKQGRKCRGFAQRGQNY